MTSLAPVLTTLAPGSAAARLGKPGNGVEHLPYGSFTHGDSGPRLGVRLGDHVLDVALVLAAAPMTRLSSGAREAVEVSTLDALLRQQRPVWDEVRAGLQDCLSDPETGERLVSSAIPVEEVQLGMPFTVADYVDFYGNEFHATNVGKIFRPTQQPLTPNWKHLPIGYHGRAGTIVISGTDFPRPQGVRPETEGNPSFGPSRRLDIEAEVGFVLGGPVTGGRVPLQEADDHVFGLTLTNDWSARDIQAFEYVPLGPNLGKSFCTTISPWITPLAALSEARVAPPARDVELSPYLDDRGLPPSGFDIDIEIRLNGQVVAVAPFAETYWTAAQMLSHMTVNGAGLRAGDFFAGGTVSGPERHQRGSFLEICWGGSEPLVLADGSEYTFLRDGDHISMTATAMGPHGSTIALGECAGRVLPAK